MNPNINQHIFPSYLPYSNYASYHTTWNHNLFHPSVRGNLVHVNPAFLQPPPAPVAHPGPNKIIVNPRFFPQVHHSNVQSQAVNTGKPTSFAATTENLTDKFTASTDPNSRSHSREPPQRIVLLPSEKAKVSSDQSRFKIKTNLKVVNVPSSSSANFTSKSPSQHIKAQTPPPSHAKRFVVVHKPSPIRLNNRVVKLSPKLKVLQANLKNKYKWKKGESPLKPLILQNAYKIVRKSSPGKSSRLSLSRKISPFNSLMILTPPKLASTPVETESVKSRFKLDNRVNDKKKAVKSGSPRGLLTKILKSKYKIVRNKLFKPNSSAVIRASFTSVSRSFTNFTTFNKSLLNRSKVHRQVIVKKPVKIPKKSKAATKAKKSNRYYDNDSVLKTKAEEDKHDDVEVVENSSGPTPRAPIGTLPSFITL